MDNPTSDSFTKLIAKAFTLNLAATAGMFAGFFVVGSAINAVQKRKDKTKTTPETV